MYSAAIFHATQLNEKIPHLENDLDFQTILGYANKELYIDG